MRRLMAATALAVLCATAAACSGSGDTPSASGGNASASSGGATASAAATSAAAGSGNTKQICEDAQKVIAESVTKFSQELGKLTASSDSAAAVQTIKTMFNDWADGIRELAGKATDAQLKAALTELADQVAKVAGSIKSMNDLAATDKLDSPEVQAAQAKFESFCG